MDNWQEDHGKIITNFLSLLNKTTVQFVLKGSTALSCCYGLDRFSEDIDLDGKNKTLKRLLKDSVQDMVSQ